MKNTTNLSEIESKLSYIVLRQFRLIFKVIQQHSKLVEIQKTLISISECLGVSYHELKIVFKKYPTLHHLEKSEVVANESSNNDDLLKFSNC